MGAFSVSDILEGVLLQYGFAIGTAVQGGDGVVGDVCVCVCVSLEGMWSGIALQRQGRNDRGRSTYSSGTIEVSLLNWRGHLKNSVVKPYPVWWPVCMASDIREKVCFVMTVATSFLLLYRLYESNEVRYKTALFIFLMSVFHFTY